MLGMCSIEQRVISEEKVKMLTEELTDAYAEIKRLEIYYPDYDFDARDDREAEEIIKAATEKLKKRDEEIQNVIDNLKIKNKKPRYCLNCNMKISTQQFTRYLPKMSNHSCKLNELSS